MQDKYKEDVAKLIAVKGALGVNALSRELDIPLSTLQKYMHKQTYFRINEDRKWDLPENVVTEIKSNTLELLANVVENNILLLKSQVEELTHSIQNALVPINSLKRSTLTQPAPVAHNGHSNIDPRLSEISKNSDILTNIFKKQKDFIPDEHKDILFNFDYVGLVIKEGETYVKEFLEDGLYELLSGKVQEITEDTLEVLKANQKGE